MTNDAVIDAVARERIEGHKSICAERHGDLDQWRLKMEKQVDRIEKAVASLRRLSIQVLTVAAVVYLLIQIGLAPYLRAVIERAVNGGH